MQLRGRAGPIYHHLGQQPRERSAGRRRCGGRGAGERGPVVLPVRPRPGSGSTAALGHQAVTESKSSPRATRRATPTLLSPHSDCHPWAFIPALTLHGAGSGPPLTSLGTPPLDGRHTTWYLRGGCGAGVQDRWTLEEVTWLRTRLVGVEAGPRAGAAAAGVAEGGGGWWLTARGQPARAAPLRSLVATSGKDRGSPGGGCTPSRSHGNQTGRDSGSSFRGP